MKNEELRGAGVVPFFWLLAIGYWLLAVSCWFLVFHWRETGNLRL